MKITNPVAVKGETAAVEYLKKLGYKILDRNVRARNTEIDIVGIDKDTLAFVEVKTRSSNRFGTPFEAIAYWKLLSLKKAALHYKLLHPKFPELLRIDAVAVWLLPNGKVEKIELIKNITGF